MLVSHLACADEPGGHAKNGAQLAPSTAPQPSGPTPRAALQPPPASISVPIYALDEVRPGIGLYGGGPTPADGPAPLPVVTLTAPVLQIREIAAGETIGYGATFTAKVAIPLPRSGSAMLTVSCAPPPIEVMA